MATSKKAIGTATQSNSKKAAAKKTVVNKTKPSPKPSKVVDSKMPNAIFNIDEINNLLMAVNHSNVNELKLEKGDFKITIRQGMPMVGSAPAQPVMHVTAPAAAALPAAPAPAVATAPAASSAEVAPDHLITVKSPMIGTFFRAGGPGKPNFVNVGDEVKVGQVICIVEAMKLFNEIESEISGKIIKVLADDSSPVEYDQPLFLIEP